jgi:rhamnose utilization protein RhaD (predicted bifunctional aldolase and dehydrogenase)
MNTNKTYDNLISLSKGISKYCVGMEGNISGKIDNDYFMIKASGQSLANLKDDGLVKYLMTGIQLNHLDKKGSMELSFHIFLLSFEGIKYVSHTHPTNTLKILCSSHSEDFANKRIFPDQVVFNGAKSCLVPYAKPGEELTELIKLHVNIFINDEGYFPKLILLQNHGVITCGNSIKECIISTDICEKAANIFVGSVGLGGVHFLSNKDIIDLVIDNKEKYRQQQLK